MLKNIVHTDVDLNEHLLVMSFTMILVLLSRRSYASAVDPVVVIESQSRVR
jgi:hypothetical protein